MVPQYAVPIDGGWALTQGRDNGSANATDDLILSRYAPEGGKALETRTAPRSGHGDRAYSVDGHLVVQILGAWSTVTFGEPWSYAPTATPARCSLRGLAGLQGEASAGGTVWLRLYGESIKDGSERDPTHRTAFLQVIDGTTVTATLDLDSVPREKGLAIGGRYEPEGVTVATINGEPTVLVGFSVGRLGSTTMRVYGRPLRYITKD